MGVQRSPRLDGRGASRAFSGVARGLIRAAPRPGLGARTWAAPGQVGGRGLRVIVARGHGGAPPRPRPRKTGPEVADNPDAVRTREARNQENRTAMNPSRKHAPRAGFSTGVGAALAVVVFLSRVPFLQFGFGTDTDTWKFASALREMSETGRYTASRMPGYPKIGRASCRERV